MSSRLQTNHKRKNKSLLARMPIRASRSFSLHELRTCRNGVYYSRRVGSEKSVVVVILKPRCRLSSEAAAPRSMVSLTQRKLSGHERRDPVH